MFGLDNFWDKSPSWFLKNLKLSLFYSGNVKYSKMDMGNLSQIALPNMWLLVVIDLTNKLYHIEVYHIDSFIKKFCKQSCWMKFNLIACTLTCGCLH